MDLQIVTWKIRGTRPLMQSNYAETMSTDTETKAVGRSTKAVRLKPFDEARRQLYASDEGYYHPAIAFWRGTLDNCTGYKIGGSAASGILPKALFMTAEDRFLLYDPATLDSKSPKKLTGEDWQMDSRRVVNSKKGALIAHRPKWPRWGGFLSLDVDLSLFPGQEAQYVQVVTTILNVFGRYGIGTGRMMQDPKTHKWGGLGLGKFEAEVMSPAFAVDGAKARKSA